MLSLACSRSAFYWVPSVRCGTVASASQAEFGEINFTGLVSDREKLLSRGQKETWEKVRFSPLPGLLSLLGLDQDEHNPLSTDMLYWPVGASFGHQATRPGRGLRE